MSEGFVPTPLRNSDAIYVHQRGMMQAVGWLARGLIAADRKDEVLRNAHIATHIRNEDLPVEPGDDNWKRADNMLHATRKVDRDGRPVNPNSVVDNVSVFAVQPVPIFEGKAYSQRGIVDESWIFNDGCRATWRHETTARRQKGGPLRRPG